MSHDSAVLFMISGHSVMHTNDARISLAQARRAMTEVGGPLDVMGVQMSGASWHPVRYEYDEVERERISTIKRVGKFKAVTRLVRQVEPRLVMPYAGPPCFLDDDLFELNSGLHVRAGSSRTRMRRSPGSPTGCPQQPGAYLLPGDRIALDRLEVIRDPHWDGLLARLRPSTSGGGIWRTTPPVGGRPSRPPGPRIPRRGPGWPSGSRPTWSRSGPCRSTSWPGSA